jgi:hypothetical protein
MSRVACSCACVLVCLLVWQCDVWHLEQLSDDTQIAWDKCMHNKNYKASLADVACFKSSCFVAWPRVLTDLRRRVVQEPNSIAQEIYDELDETEDGEVGDA